MKKLLFVIYSLDFGGSEKSLVNLLNELPADMYEVDLLLFQKRGVFLEQVPSWVNVLDTPKALNGLYSPVRKAGRYAPTKIVGTVCARIARRTVKEKRAFRWRFFFRKKIGRIPGRYDVAIAYGGMENLYLITDCVDAGRKLVWIHSDYQMGKYPQKDDKPYFQKMDAIVSISHQCVDVLSRVFPELEDRMYCIENITSSDVLRKQADAYTPPELSKDMCNILSIGRLAPVKAFHRAIEAAALLKKAGLRFHWYVIGGGALHSELTSQIAAHDVADCFTLLGPRTNPYPYIKACDVFVQTSDYEGKSMVLDEAKILGKPLVVTDYPTVHDQVQQEKEGLIADKSAEGVAMAIQRLLSDDKLRQNIAAYLSGHEYGNSSEISKYISVIEGNPCV